LEGMRMTDGVDTVRQRRAARGVLDRQSLRLASGVWPGKPYPALAGLTRVNC
jgi:hypothetical protein